MTNAQEEAEFDRAEALLAEYQQRGEEPFEAFLARHPALDRQLRELWSLCDEVGGVLGEEAVLVRERQRRVTELLDELKQKDAFAERYSIEAEIGKGGMGAVFRVQDKKFSRPLAMKLILGQAAGERSGKTPPVEPGELLRFLDEARITSQLDHPSIVPVHEVGVDTDGRAYFTMKLVQGRTLEKMLTERGASGRRQALLPALNVIERVCAALAFAHERGVLHRDLKPSNVMVGDFGEVYVMDWGLARRAMQRVESAQSASEDDLGTISRARELHGGSSTTTRPGEVLGTPAYMSPEQAAGRPADVTERSDVYAIGAMLYYLLAGHAPYCTRRESSEPTAVLQRIQAGPPERLSNRAAPAELIAICEKAMAREREQRYANAGELREDLQAFVEGGFVKAYPRGKWARLARWSRRNPALAASAAVILFLILVAAWNALEAARKGAEVMRLTAHGRLDELEREADALWPIQPDHRPRYEAWLQRAQVNLAMLAEYQANVEHLERRVVQLEGRDRGREFGELAGARWSLGLGRSLVARLEALTDPVSGLFDGASTLRGLGVRRRLALSETLTVDSLASAGAQAAWDETSTSLANDPHFAGVELRPIFGLLPIGKDPRSGLWEFAHLLSGAPAQRDTSGELRWHEDTGIVLVLLPGGDFRMGTDVADPDAARVLGTSVEESPAHVVHLAPFFVSKFETTQAQWMRLFGANQSRHNPANYRAVWNREGGSGSLLHPAELVDWGDAGRFASWSGLEILTEAQWEYAARAGSERLWPTGDEEASLEGFANVSDGFAKAHGADWRQFTETIDDGHTVHAPVGTYARNAFGLHDMLGNVSEWCRDLYGSYASAHNPGDGERIVPDARARVVRGGSYSGPGLNARPGYRDDMDPTARQASLGFRVGRRIDGAR